MRMILRVAGCSSSTWYEKSNSTEQKRGVKPKHSDAEVLAGIRKVISSNEFKGEGYKKVCFRLRKLPSGAIHASKERVNRLMRENNLLSPFRIKKSVEKREHKGKIKTREFNQMWATDGKKFWVDSVGWCWFFGVIEHCNNEILSWHIAKKGSRFAALEPVKEAIRAQFGGIGKDVCEGMTLKLRSDHGSQYTSDVFQNQMKFWGLKMSMSFVAEPECNGIIERFHRTLEEEVFAVNRFTSIEHAREVINRFIDSYNKNWILHRLKLLSPIEYREREAQRSRAKENDAA